MAPTFKALTDYFINIGADQVNHSNKTYLAHAIGVHRDLQAWGCDEQLCQAGLFHSIYGTEGFQGFTLPLTRQAELIEMIGERAERLASQFSAVARPFEEWAQAVTDADVVITSTENLTIGTSESEHDLSGLDAPLRSHGGLTEQEVPFIANRKLDLPQAPELRNFDVLHYACMAAAS